MASWRDANQFPSYSADPLEILAPVEAWPGADTMNERAGYCVSLVALFRSRGHPTLDNLKAKTVAADAVPTWVVPLMRLGYAARGVVYGLIGLLAMRAAWIGGHAKGAQAALLSLLDERFGNLLLWAIAGGAFCFAIWTLLAALMDLDHRGTDGRGIVARLDFAGTSIVYVAIGVFIADLAHKGYGAGDDASRERGTAWLLTLPAGGWIVIGLGAGFVLAGIWFGFKAFSGIYKERLETASMVALLDPICRFGWTAYGVVVVILGGFLIWAGWTMDPTKAGGLAEAFAVIRQATFGRVLLLVVGFGFVAFAIECFVEAAYRILPARRRSSGT